MNGMLKMRDKRVLSAIKVFVMMLIIMALTPIAAHAADNPLTLEVNQVFTTSLASADDTFTYRLRSLESGNPMPAGSTAEGYTFQIKGNNSVEIPSILYTQQGIYRYELYQVVATPATGYLYDGRVYTVEVYVESTSNVEVILVNEDLTKASSIDFVNACTRVNNPVLMIDPPVMKTVSGTPSTDSIFYFRLVAANPTQPMPAGSMAGVKTIQITGSGYGEFGTWNYDTVGIYFYTVSEVNTSIQGYTYDTTVYTITDTVTDDNGQLVLSRVVTNNQNKPVTSMPFINTYTSAAKPIDVPKTGDDSNIPFNILLLVLGGVLAVGSAQYLMMERKRQAEYR